MARFSGIKASAYQIPGPPPVGEDDEMEAAYFDPEGQARAAAIEKAGGAFRTFDMTAPGRSILDPTDSSRTSGYQSIGEMLTPAERAAARDMTLEQVAPLSMFFIGGKPYFDLITALHTVEGWKVSAMITYDWKGMFQKAESLAIQQNRLFGRVYWEATTHGFYVPWVTFQQFEWYLKARDEMDTAEVLQNIKDAYNATVRIVVAAERIYSILYEHKEPMTGTEIWKKNQTIPGWMRFHAMSYLVKEGRVKHESFKSGQRGAPCDVYEVMW